MTALFQVLWTLTTEKDVSAIIRYIVENDRETAFLVLERIRQTVKQLNESPERGRVIPELKKQGISSYRELIVSPWRIMYRVSGGKIFVLSVIDGRMNVEDVLLNRFL